MNGKAPRPHGKIWTMRMRGLPLALMLAAVVPAGAGAAMAQPAAESAATVLTDELAARADSDERAFYAARGWKPVWISDGALSPAADTLLERVRSARLDGVKPSKLKFSALRRAVNRAASGEPDDLAEAELALSDSFARYVREMRRVRPAAMIFESAALAPVVPTQAAALRMAAASPSLERYIAAMGWMHPLYAPLRDALADPRLSRDQRAVIAQNLSRVRALPGTPPDKYILVDAVSARLWMYEGGKPVDSMRVVVGKAQTQTPAMAGFVRYAIVNPYWNVPPDLVQLTIANNVLDKGTGYLKTNRYQVLSDWSDTPAIVDPAKVDWHAVAAGTAQPRVRQLPGGPNFMGKVKFEFPNPQGIYLHDTPSRDLLKRDDRQLSNGCVRLEDADRLGRWLLEKRLPARVRTPEQRIDLPRLVPVYITYLTAMPEDGRIAFRSDVYGRDARAGGRARFARAD